MKMPEKPLCGHSGVILSEDDPIMALVPLLNAFSDTLKANLSKAMDLFGERSRIWRA